ncbi:hypothetical protein [Leptospira ellisii]|uniref:hypothetical protein n=1 Tax=Leptospira ellisii TaxID=2023197 RepID=UPI00311AB493
MNSILFPAPDTRPSRFNAGSGPDSAGKYVQAYMGALNIQTMAQIYFLQQLDLICMGMCMLTIPYVNEIQTHYNYRDQINDVVGGIRNEGIKLKNLYTELQTLTDVDDTDQLLSVLGRPEFGLTAEDLTMIGKVSPSTNGLKDLVWKSTTDTPTPLSFNDLVGSDGLRLAQQKAIHDSYGNYVRDNEYAAGNITAGAEQTDQYGRKTALMVGSDEFLDAMGVLAEAQYQVARDAYYKKAESFVKQVGTGADKVAVKVDTKVILDEREQFMSDLLKKITNTSNGETVAYNVETTIYKTVLNDYMGPTGVVSQIFGSELQQRQQQQMQQWDLKEREFYDLKSDWVQNVSYIKQTGTKRWENMVQEFQSKWTDWRTEYKTQHEANQKVFLDRIEQTLEKKETWTKDFLQKSSEVSDELSLRQMYDSIAGIVSSMQENLPTGVSVNINVNDILSNILSKKPGSISSSLIDRASSIDTNFFLNEVKKFNFNDGGVKEQFKNLMKEMDKLSQNLIILQTLESLRSLPEAFATAVKKQNEAADKQLDSTMAYGGFARMGGAYMRSIKTASGGDEIQVLATYLPFLYNPPNKFPEVKDSNGKLWDLGKADALINGNNVPSPSDLTVMVRLAKNKMSADFKKVLNPEKQRNYELELGLFDPSELLDSMNDFIEGVREGETVSCMNKTPEECAKSAMSSGFLVGEVPDGDFGFAQFGQFYQILKTKKEMDKRKAKMDQARKRKSGGMGRFYNQIGAIGEGYAEMIKGTGQMLLSGGKAYLKAITGDFDGAKKDLKAAGKAGERALQGYLYAVSGVVDFVMFAAETVLEPVVGILTLGQGTDAMNGKFAEGNYELAKFRDGNKAQRQLNELGTRTGAEMYANDAIVDKIVTTTLAVVGIVGAILSFTPLAPIGVGMMAISAVGTMAWKSFRGAYEGGAAGMAAGMVSGAINAALEKPTAGMLSVNLSYSYEGGFGAGVDVGTPSSWKVGGSLGLNYNSKTGAWGASAGVKIGLGSQNAAGDFTKSAGLTYNRNNIGRDDQSSGWNAELSGPFNDAGTKGSMSLTYDTKVGYGASVGFTSEFGPLSVTPSWSISQKTGLNSDIQYGFSSDIFSSDENPEHAAANRNLFGEILNGMGAAFGAMRLQDQLIEAQGSGSPGRLINDIEKKSLMEAMTGPGASKEKTEQLVANLEALGVDSDQLRKIVDDYRKKTGRTLMSDEERINIYNYRLSLGLDQNGMADFLYSDYYKSDRELAKLYYDLKAKTIQEHQPSPSGIEGINSDKIKNDASEHSQYYLDNKIKDKIENAKKILMEHPELISDVNLRNKFLNQSSLSASAAICVVDSDFIMLKNNGALGEDGKPLTFEEFYIKGVQRGAIKLDKNKFGTEGFFFVQDPKKLFEGYRDSNGNTFELRTEFAKKSGDSYVYDSQNQEYLKNQIRNNTNVGVVRRAAYDKSLFDFLGNSKTKYLKDDGHSYNGFVDQYGVFKPVDVAKPNRDTFSPIIRIDYLIKIAEGGL